MIHWRIIHVFLLLSLIYMLHSRQTGAHCIRFLVGQKCDLVAQREVSIDEVNEFMTTSVIAGGYFEVSARNNTGVEEFVEVLHQTLIESLDGIPSPIYEKNVQRRGECTIC
jgi:GTPase SAR1 family protein